MGSLLNKVAYVTGASRGLGKALAELLLSENYFVFGISRSESQLKHPNFEWVSLDLSDLEAVKKFQFFPKQNERVVLINNAGIVGDIAPVGKVDLDAYEKVHQVNTIAPQILTDLFFRTYIDLAEEGHVLNISSGAGKRPIDAWSAYCSSKAALDLFTETFIAECKERTVKNWYAHAIAPGVVDTQMQEEIRQANPDHFKSLEKFQKLHSDGELKSPEAVAELIYRVIQSPDRFSKSVISVRDFD